MHTQNNFLNAFRRFLRNLWERKPQTNIKSAESPWDPLLSQIHAFMQIPAYEVAQEGKSKTKRWLPEPGEGGQDGEFSVVGKNPLLEGIMVQRKELEEVSKNQMACPIFPGAPCNMRYIIFAFGGFRVFTWRTTYRQDPSQFWLCLQNHNCVLGLTQKWEAHVMDSMVIIQGEG